MTFPITIIIQDPSGPEYDRALEQAIQASGMKIQVLSRRQPHLVAGGVVEIILAFMAIKAADHYADKIFDVLDAAVVKTAKILMVNLVHGKKSKVIGLDRNDKTKSIEELEKEIKAVTEQESKDSKESGPLDPPSAQR